MIYGSDTTKSPQTTIPFVKNNNFNYSWFTQWMGDNAETGGWILFFFIVIFIVSATSNGANLNDGLDGMTAGLSAISRCGPGHNGLSWQQRDILGIPQHYVHTRE